MRTTFFGDIHDKDDVFLISVSALIWKQFDMETSEVKS